MLVDVLVTALPQEAPLLAGLAVMLALFYTAAIDAKTGLVPPVPLALAGLLMMAVLISTNSERALTAPLYALGFYMAIFLVNELHYQLTERDALGLGDAHWSLVAVLAFGPMAVLMAWGLGAWLAILWLAGRRLAGKAAGQVYFVPFLFVALMLIQLRGLLSFV